MGRRVKPYTVHGVLAANYRGKALSKRVLLTHASLDQGSTAICKRVKDGELAEAEDGEPTCLRCISGVKLLQKIEKCL